MTDISPSEFVVVTDEDDVNVASPIIVVTDEDDVKVASPTIVVTDEDDVKVASPTIVVTNEDDVKVASPTVVVTNEDDVKVASPTDKGKLPLRIRIDNVPTYYNTLQVRKLLSKTLPGVEYHQLKTMRKVAIMSFNTHKDALNAFNIFNGMKIKNFLLSAKFMNEEQVKAIKKRSHYIQVTNKIPTECTTASDLVTPLARLDYPKQLEKKFIASKSIVINLLQQIVKVGNEKAWSWRNNLKEVIPSPIVTEYRNKCEFSVGKATSGIHNGLSCVGFVHGRMADKELNILNVENCTNMTKNTLEIVSQFEQFIRNFDNRLEAFNEFKREGFWKMLTVRDFRGDCMVIVTVHLHPDAELVMKAKRALADKFICFGDSQEKFNFRVTSLYWQTIENASDPKIYEHIAGTHYVYENLLGARFRISPSTFFQINSRAAEVLYTKIGDALLPSSELSSEAADEVPKNAEVSRSVEDLNGNDDINNNGENNEVSDESKNAKRAKLNSFEAEILSAGQAAPTAKSDVLLDICCGSGSISICLMKRMISLSRQKKILGNIGCIGVELVSEAIRDAKINAVNNGFNTKKCLFLTGKAEIIFKDLQYHMPQDCLWVTANLLGVLDPPRAGVSDKVIIGCRKLEQMKRLVYVSCDPKAAIKNLTDLCRPTSNKYAGNPFEIESIQPIDMFPQTEHFEWVVSLRRENVTQ